MNLVVRIAVLILLAALLLPAVAAACPNCKDASSDAETPGGSASLGRGFYWSILLMVAAPFTVIGAFAITLLRARRRRTRDAEGPLARTRPAVPLGPDTPGARV
jgi:heme/copper-type cytochrome/quinol oxidase subunit 2